jgi:hypothetical protein
MAAQYENLSSDLIWQISRTFPTRENTLHFEEGTGYAGERDGTNLWARKCCAMDGACVARSLEEQKKNQIFEGGIMLL